MNVTNMFDFHALCSECESISSQVVSIEGRFDR